MHYYHADGSAAKTLDRNEYQHHKKLLIKKKKNKENGNSRVRVAHCGSDMLNLYLIFLMYVYHTSNVSSSFIGHFL